MGRRKFYKIIVPISILVLMIHSIAFKYVDIAGFLVGGIFVLGSLSLSYTSYRRKTLPGNLKYFYLVFGKKVAVAVWILFVSAVLAGYFYYLAKYIGIRV